MPNEANGKLSSSGYNQCFDLICVGQDYDATGEHFTILHQLYV